MNRRLSVLGCVILGMGLLICGLQVPAHLRAVDAHLIQQAGRNTPTLVEAGLAAANEKNIGAARLLLQGAQAERLPDRDQLSLTIYGLIAEDPGLQTFGGAEPIPPSSGNSSPATATSEPFTEWIIQLANREKVLALLAASSNPGVHELLQFRAATNTVLFPPSQSASGQALDAGLSIAGLLIEKRRLSASLNNAIQTLAYEANRGANSQPFEEALMNLMSLGQRFDWGALVAFVGRIDDVETLRFQANLVRKTEGQLPVLFSAVQLSGNPAAVAGYLMNFSQTGLKDLGSSLRFGAGGVNELLRRNQRLCDPGLPWKIAPAYCLRMPWPTLALKWFSYLFAGFLLAASWHFAQPLASRLERPLEVRGFHVAREILFGLGFLLVVLLLSEPFLAQDSQRVEFPFRLRLPTAGSVIRAETARVHPSIMNQLSLLALLLFFVLQGLLYTASVLKLAEIRRQKMPPRMKLKLLENEDHLFDAGLYLGFVGTIISLILVSLGVIKPSLMAAYSSTSFGIIFVSIFKILHLRPARRKLLLDAEPAVPEPAVSGSPQALAIHL